MSLIVLFVSMFVVILSMMLCVVVISVDVMMFENVMIDVIDRLILLSVSMNIIVIVIELISVIDSNRFWMLCGVRKFGMVIDSIVNSMRNIIMMLEWLISCYMLLCGCVGVVVVVVFGDGEVCWGCIVWFILVYLFFG